MDPIPRKFANTLLDPVVSIGFSLFAQFWYDHVHRTHVAKPKQKTTLQPRETDMLKRTLLGAIALAAGFAVAATSGQAFADNDRFNPHFPDRR